jgi:hypothetical protein
VYTLMHTHNHLTSLRIDSRIAAYLSLHMRRNLPYALSFTSPTPMSTEPIDQIGEFQQVRHAEYCSLPTQGNFWIGSKLVRPLRPNYVDQPVVAL